VINIPPAPPAPPASLLLDPPPAIKITVASLGAAGFAVDLLKVPDPVIAVTLSLKASETVFTGPITPPLPAII
jgi:hypothetical protein